MWYFSFRPSSVSNPSFSLPAMRKYKEWSQNGKPELTREEIDQAVSEPKSPGKRVNNTYVPENKSVVLPDTSAIHSAGAMHNGRKEKFLTYFVPDDNPRDIERIDQYNHPINSTLTSISSKSFQDLCLEKLNVKPSSSNTKKNERKLIHMAR